MRVDLDEHALCGVDVDLQQARLVERRIKQRQQTLFPQDACSEKRHRDTQKHVENAPDV